MSTKLLITGSRDSTPAAHNYVEKVLDRVKELGWEVIVGDATGVDLWVAQSTADREIPTTVYGITNQPRNGANYHSYVKVLQVGNIPATFLIRDRQMVELADRVLAIWNGSSRGTKYTFEYAQKRKLPVDVRTFRG